MEISLEGEIFDVLKELLLCVDNDIVVEDGDGNRFYFFSSLIWISEEYCFLFLKDDMLFYFLSCLISVSGSDV